MNVYFLDMYIYMEGNVSQDFERGKGNVVQRAMRVYMMRKVIVIDLCLDGFKLGLIRIRQLRSSFEYVDHWFGLVDSVDLTPGSPTTISSLVGL